MYKYYHICGMFFISLLIVSNTIATKLISVGPFLVASSIIVFPISYIFGDILTEVYGYAAARHMTWIGIACLVLVTGFYALAVWIPPAAIFRNEPAFDTVFSVEPRIVLASIVAFCLGSFANDFAMSRIKVLTNKRLFWLRAVTSTISGESADSLVFYTIAFAGVLSPRMLIWSAISGAIVKTIYEILALPVTYRVCAFLKKVEGVDALDTGISYNPLIFGLRNLVPSKPYTRG